jgi:hypothetical protein
LTEAFPERPLVAEVQVILKVNMTDEVSRATASGTDWLPLVALVPVQLSSAPPPAAAQSVALDDFHVTVVDLPAVMVVGEAEIETATGGQFQTTEADTLTAATPEPVQFSA